MIERHLRRVNPRWPAWRLRQGVQEAFDSYARYWIESLRLPTLSARTVAAGFAIDGFHHVTDGLERGKGVILALPHLGGWEWAGRWLADRGTRSPSSSSGSSRRSCSTGSSACAPCLGMNVVPLGPSAAVRPCCGRCATTRSSACCATATSRAAASRSSSSASARRCRPGRRRSPCAPARRSCRSACYFTRRVNGHRAVIRAPVPTERAAGSARTSPRITQDLARELEYLIRRAPEQWHLFQPNWPSDPGYPHRS